MSEVTDISFILQDSLLLSNVKNNSTQTDTLKTIQTQLNNLPSVLDEETLTKLKNGGYEISLQEYTSMSTYNTMMTALYGNNSANKFQNTLNLLTNSAEDNLASAKAFVDKMKSNGMSNETALKTYTALQKYSLMSSFSKNSFVNANI